MRVRARARLELAGTVRGEATLGVPSRSGIGAGTCCEDGGFDLREGGGRREEDEFVAVLRLSGHFSHGGYNVGKGVCDWCAVSNRSELGQTEHVSVSRLERLLDRRQPIVHGYKIDVTKNIILLGYYHPSFR